MALTPHICGQHLSGTAHCGYDVTPDTAVLLAPKLFLRGGAAKIPAVYFGASPNLTLKAGAFGIMISSLISPLAPKLFLVAGEAHGFEPGILPAPPAEVIIFPTTEEDFVLIPTTEESLLLVPTVVGDM